MKGAQPVVSPCPRGAEVAQRQDEQDQAHADPEVAHKPRCGDGGAEEGSSGQQGDPHVDAACSGMPAQR